ncbi:hypothetical protein F4776DRAFT_562334 [Hypoxylon sp. NC0597]|nr:hypothetical protein F4776DRAFT_562334 [Hypoxylon sp. NC0597]
MPRSPDPLPSSGFGLFVKIGPISRIRILILAVLMNEGLNYQSWWLASIHNFVVDSMNRYVLESYLAFYTRRKMYLRKTANCRNPRSTFEAYCSTSVSWGVQVSVKLPGDNDAQPRYACALANQVCAGQVVDGWQTSGVNGSRGRGFEGVAGSRDYAYQSSEGRSRSHLHQLGAPTQLGSSQFEWRTLDTNVPTSVRGSILLKPDEDGRRRVGDQIFCGFFFF